MPRVQDAATSDVLPHRHLDSVLTVSLPPGLPGETVSVLLTYSTSPTAAALQWLEPEQTASNRLPFVFSQCQAIACRSNSAVLS